MNTKDITVKFSASKNPLGLLQTSVKISAPTAENDEQEPIGRLTKSRGFRTIGGQTQRASDTMCCFLSKNQNRKGRRKENNARNKSGFCSCFDQRLLTKAATSDS
jgi:hypothetical protein